MGLEQTPKPLLFELTPHPLGCEVKVSWEFQEVLAPRYKLLIFKRSKTDITDEEISRYVAEQTKESLGQSKIFVFLNISNDQTSINDTVVEEGQTYFYRAIVVDREDRGTFSDVVNASVKVPTFEIKMSVVPTKDIVIDAIKKIMRGVAKQTNANIMVYQHFPLKVTDPAYVVVTRSSGESAYRSLSDLVSSNAGHVVTGDIDSDTIQVAWMTNANPSLRDKFSDIFRGSKRVLKRHLRMQPGVIDVNYTMLGDGAEDVDGQQLHYGSMLINVMIQNLLETDGEEEMLKDIMYEFTFETDDSENQ